MATILSEGLGRKIVYYQCDPHEMRHRLLQTGMSENAADLMLEMYEAVENGRLQPTQPRSKETTTPTRFADFAHEIVLPLIGEAVHH